MVQGLWLLLHLPYWALIGTLPGYLVVASCQGDLALSPNPLRSGEWESWPCYLTCCNTGMAGPASCPDNTVV